MLPRTSAGRMVGAVWRSIGRAQTLSGWGVILRYGFTTL